MTAVALAIAGTILWACGGSGKTTRDRTVFWTGLALIGCAFVLGGSYG